MTPACEQCKEWRKEQYWNKFPDNIKHICKPLIGDFKNFLRIPSKFKAEFKGKLSKKVILRGPSGNTWITTLAKRGENFVLQNGWQKFVKDHDLHEHDILVFRYVEDSLFEVLIFEKTACEREDAYFVEPDVENCCSSRNDSSTRRKSSAAIDQQRSKRQRKTMTNEKELLQEEESSSDDRGSQHDTSGADSETREGNNGSRLRYSIYYKSNRRPITKEDKDRAFLLATKHLTKRPFCKIRMKPSHVHHLFMLTIPREFAENCLPMKTQSIKLRVGSKSWQVKLYLRNAQCMLTTGWAQFVLDNNIETEDYCILELVRTGTSQQPTTLEVHIFRAVEQIVPLEVIKPLQPH